MLETGNCLEIVLRNRTAAWTVQEELQAGMPACLQLLSWSQGEHLKTWHVSQSTTFT
jgi:hypothetical protein